MKKILFNLLIISITCNTVMGQITTGIHPERNKVMVKLLDDFAKAFNAHDVNAILSFMTTDCIFEASAGPEVNGEKFTGQEAVRKAFENVFATFPDAQWRNARHFISGDRAVSEWTFSGTKQDGSKVEVTGCDLFTFRDGKIAVKNSYRKNRSPVPKG